MCVTDLFLPDLAAQLPRVEFLQDHKRKSVPVNLPEPGDARDAAGKTVGVSGKTVDFATRVIKKAGEVTCPT